jgi:hypothetical protein
MKSYPKIFALGTKYIADIFNNEVEVTEKIDGSQFSFGKFNGVIGCRSKGCELYFDNPEGMFKKGIEYVQSIADKLPDNTWYYGEFLGSRKHNILAYDREPKNNIILFAVCDNKLNFRPPTDEDCDLLQVERVPVLFKGKVEDLEMFNKLLDIESVLGGQKVEGVVVKDYSREMMIGGQVIPLMSGKYVSEDFKEKHQTGWDKEHRAKGRIDLFLEQFATEARWHKAIQHLRERGELDESPRDIGKLMKEINQDVTEEEKESIKDFLWGEYKGELARKVGRGFPEWYKRQLLENSLQ